MTVMGSLWRRKVIISGSDVSLGLLWLMRLRFLWTSGATTATTAAMAFSCVSPMPELMHGKHASDED